MDHSTRSGCIRRTRTESTRPVSLHGFMLKSLAEFDSTTDPVTKADDLDCHFDAPCCWHNDVDADTLDFRSCAAKPDATKFHDVMEHADDTPSEWGSRASVIESQPPPTS